MKSKFIIENDFHLRPIPIVLVQYEVLHWQATYCFGSVATHLLF